MILGDIVTSAPPNKKKMERISKWKKVHHSPPPTKLARLSSWRAPSPFFGIGGGLFFWTSFRQLRCESQEKKHQCHATPLAPVALVRHDVPILWLLMLKHHGCYCHLRLRISHFLVMPLPGNLPTETKQIQRKSRKKSMPMHSGCIKPCNLSNNLDLTGSDLFPSTVPHEKWQWDLGLPRGILLVVEDFWARKKGRRVLMHTEQCDGKLNVHLRQCQGMLSTDTCTFICYLYHLFFVSCECYLI